MKDLDRNKVYSLGNIKKDDVKFNQLKEWLVKNDKGWDNEFLFNLKYYRYVYYNNRTKGWYYSDSKDSFICALTLFEESDLNIDIYPNLFFE